MSTLLILLVLAVAAYLVHGAASRPSSGRTSDSVTEFNRALSALDPHQGARRGQRVRRAGAGRSASTRRPAA